MRKCLVSVSAACCVLFAMVATTHALTLGSTGNVVPGTYLLLDHGDGALGDNYGLRADSITPPSGVGPTFSVELGGAAATLVWPGGPTATITGTLFNNNTVGALWTVNYTITGITTTPTGFVATGGSGNLFDPNTSTNYTMIGKQNGDGDAFLFQGDGHRAAPIGLPSNTQVGRGWLEPPNSTDDWLVRASFEGGLIPPVPEPSAVLVWGLMGLSSVGMVWLKRRRRR